MDTHKLTEQDKPLHKYRVLVVEDDLDTNQFIATTLSDQFNVITAMDGMEGIEAVITQSPDLIVSDLIMPRMDGEQMVHAIRQRPEFNSIPIILLTSISDEKQRFKLLKEGVQDYLIKPFSQWELKLRVNNLISLKSAKLDLYKQKLEIALILEKNKMKNEFLANMSHELRTPLNAIIGFSELIFYNKAGTISEEQKEYIGDITSSAKHLLSLINDLLDLTKIESGKMEFHPEEINLFELLSEIKSNLFPLFFKRQIELIIQVDPALEPIVTDPQKLKQVIYNYISNALKFSPDGGRIEIYACNEGKDTFRVEVHDYGIGIKKENLDKLFNKFQQLDSSTSKEYQGSGLGLALTRHIVESQGGHIGVNSTYGKGSSFFIILPRTSKKNAPAGLNKTAKTV